MSRILGAVVLFASLMGVSCGDSSVPEPVVSALDGAWQTEGYGHLLKIDGEAARLYELTAVSCLFSYELVVRDSPRADAEAVLVLAEAGLEIDVQPGGHGGERWLRIDSLASRRRLSRIGDLPAVCDQEASTDPLAVFDTFWQTYAEHYPFFAMKGIDWGAVRERERAKLDSDSSDEELFEVLKGMMEPLEDAHTYLVASDLERGYGGRRPDPNPLGEEAVARAFEIIDENYLVEPPTASCNEQIFSGKLVGGVGYFRLRSFNSYGSDFGDGLVCLESTLDTLFAEPAAMSGLVLDVRINDGGADPYGLAIASRLATEEYLAYTKETRNDPSDPSRWSAGQPSLVRPSSRVGFGGPTVLLTGRGSVSAAETFTMALMGRTPPITRIGENTQGVFSDVLTRSLPNGWRFGLPNERFLTEDGRSFDGPGVPPDIEVPVFTAAELESGTDAALEAALEVLARSD